MPRTPVTFTPLRWVRGGFHFFLLPLRRFRPTFPKRVPRSAVPFPTLFTTLPPPDFCPESLFPLRTLQHSDLQTLTNSNGQSSVSSYLLRAAFLTFVFMRLHTLPFSVSCKPFICHSYEKYSVSTNNSHSGTRSVLDSPHPPYFRPSSLTSYQSAAAPPGTQGLLRRECQGVPLRRFDQSVKSLQAEFSMPCVSISSGSVP